MSERLTVTPSRAIGRDEFERIQRLRTLYYRDVLEGYPAYRVPQFVGRTTLSNWRNPNSAVGSSLTRQGQGFARARSGLIHSSDGELRGVSLFADNASSTRHGLMGTLEVTAKLYMPSFEQRRYRVVRELAALSTEHTGQLLELAFEDAHPHQPQSAYVLSAEQNTREVLIEAGFRLNEDFHAAQQAAPVMIGTQDMPPVTLERYDR